MAKRSDDVPFDRDLADLPPEMRWREWMSRVEAVIFASPDPVPRAVLARVVGDECPLDAVIADIRGELRNRPYDLVAVAGGWHHRTRPQLAPVLRAMRPTGGVSLPALGQTEQVLLAAIAYHQPVTRRDLERLFGRTVEADAVSRLRASGLVEPGPRSPLPGAPLTFVTTETFLDHFGLESLADLPNLEDLRAMGMVDTAALDGTPAGAPPPEDPPPQAPQSLPKGRAPTGPPATDLTSPVAALNAASARVAARLQALTLDEEEAASLKILAK